MKLYTLLGTFIFWAVIVGTSFAGISTVIVQDPNTGQTETVTVTTFGDITVVTRPYQAPPNNPFAAPNNPFRTPAGQFPGVDDNE
jgi:hypothetical protein